MRPARRFALLLGATASLAALTPVACGPGEDALFDLLQSKAALFINGGFEADAGTLNGWTINTYLNNNGIAAVPPTSKGQLNLVDGGTVRTFARTNAVRESQLFAGMTADGGPPRWPKFDTTSVVINETAGANSTNANSLKQAYVVTNADVDPVDNKIHVRFVLAPALQAAGHVPAQQPYFFVVLTNLTTGATLYTNYNYANNPGVPWKSQGTGDTAVLYTDWTIFDIAPGNAALRVGDNVEVEIFASRCQPSGHFGEVYVDGFGSNFPGLSVSKTTVQAANVDSNLTYNFVVENNTSGIAPNVVANEVLPFGTTFVSASTSYPGATCTTPAVGATGTVSCSFGYLNPSASATFQVTVRAFPTAPNGSGTATAGAAGTLTDSTQAWTANAYSGFSVYLVGGQGVGQFRTIVSNTATALTVTPNWTTAPNNTSAYKIVNPPLDTGSASANSGNNTLTDNTKVWVDNAMMGYTVTVLSGTGAGQQRTILSNTPTVLTLSANWGTNPPSGSRFAIGLPPDKVVNGNYSVQGSTIAPLIGPRVETVITAGVQYTDLAIAVSDGTPAVNWGGAVQYTITVTNAGPLAVTGATVTDTFPAQLTGVTWTCSGSGGGTCAASGSGNLSQPVNIPAGGSVTFVVSATVIAGTGNASMTNTATVAVPAGMTDFDSRNNSDADTDGIGPLFPLQVNKNASDTGLGTVTSSPASIACANACATATAQYSSGTVVVLTAVARAGDVFTGWEGDCSGTASTCSVSMTAARTVTARFSGPTITGSAGTGGTVVCTPSSVLQGGSATCTITPGADYALSTVTDNGANVLGSVSGGTYTLTNVTANHTVAATFNRRPDITSTASTVAAAGTAYTYTPAANDPDGPGPLAWSAAAGDTCGGSVNPGTGQYTFTPGAPASCVVGVNVCDANVPPACRVQLTTVTINHAPVTTNDTASTSPNTALVLQGSTLSANDSPGGPPSEASQTLTVTGVSATSANGGTVTLVGGVVTYTPPNGFTGTDTFTYTVTDSGNPALSATGTVTVTVANGAPTITSTAGTAATEDTVFTYAATSTDADGPGATWSVGAGDTCGGSIDPSTGVYTFTPAGPTPPATCVMSVQVCDGGIPNRCATQTTTVNIAPVNDPPAITSTGPTAATEGQPLTYTPASTDPDGPGATWSRGAGDTCGGSVDPSTGAYTFTPMGPTPPATCVISVQVCDGATPDACVTQTTTVNITPVNDAPTVTSTAPSTGTAGTPYSYTPAVSDPDGPSITWSVGANDTCGGSVDPSTGRYTFTPPASAPPPATCVVSVKVCDGGAPAQCTTQDTPVTIGKGNAPPEITSTPPTGGTGGKPVTYKGTATDLEGTTLTWSVGPDDTCGTTVQDPATGEYTFTPANPPPASCVLSVKVCDSGTPPQCTTQSAVITLAPGSESGWAEDVGISGGGCNCGSVGALPAGLWAAVTMLALRRRSRRTGARA